MNLSNSPQNTAKSFRPLSDEEFIKEEGRKLHERMRLNGFYQSQQMTSRYVNSHRDAAASTARVDSHRHSFYELLFCRSASNVEYLVGETSFPLKKGDIVLVPPNITHGPILPEKMEEPYIRDVIWISEEFMLGICEKFPADVEALTNTAGLIRTEASAMIGDLFRKGVLEAEAGEIGWEAALAANTLSILVAICRCMVTKPPQKSERADLLEQILAYVNLHLSEKITLADVAGHFFVSESTITQTFRKQMGVSFYRCVTRWRVNYAKSLMEQGAPLETVAEQSGFSDYSAFFRAFKQECGMCPRQYKKQLAQYSK